MCKTGKIFCPRCDVFISETGDEDDDYYFEFCEDFDTCYREKHVNIEYVHYYFGLCPDCKKIKQSTLKELHDHLDFFLVCNDIKLLRYNRHMEKLLEIIYLINVDDLNLYPEEKKAVSMKMKRIIPNINKYVFRLGHWFNENNGSQNLIFRSAVQFLIDELKMWPTEDGVLGEYLTRSLTKDSVDTFDAAIIEWQENPPSLAVDVIYYPKEDYIRPPNVPTSHTWWSTE